MHEEIIKELELTSNAILQAVSNLSEQQTKHKVSPQVWSIHECLEHIVITEIAVYRILMQQTPEDLLSSESEKLGKEKIERILSNREAKREAPDDVKPVGRFSSLDELTEKFTSNRSRISESLEQNKIIFGNRIILHPALGEMTKKDWLNFLIHHSERHCKQILEIRSLVELQTI